MNATKALDIIFPTDNKMQEKMAAQFEKKSDISLKNCVGAVDGILIWTDKPNKNDLKRQNFGPKKFFVGESINMASICRPLAMPTVSLLPLRFVIQVLLVTTLLLRPQILTEHSVVQIPAIL